MNRQQQGVGNVFSLWEQRRRFAAVYVICLVVKISGSAYVSHSAGMQSGTNNGDSENTTYNSMLLEHDNKRMRE
ncbi:uncharacterized protein A4U43_C03F14600 [Asparagus officinalis]|uniref:Uncharacterized protein n=1 Tax=Asparagus officinalis TaxID=4686 RepID=A0A5P1FEA8_ASPOF|nr:uncharacterized protein A4U43_C03F14600 [Asparagus officinalis]